jgi:hypothetical protein
LPNLQYFAALIRTETRELPATADDLEFANTFEVTRPTAPLFVPAYESAFVGPAEAAMSAITDLQKRASALAERPVILLPYREKIARF